MSVILLTSPNVLLRPLYLSSHALTYHGDYCNSGFVFCSSFLLKASLEMNLVYAWQEDLLNR